MPQVDSLAPRLATAQVSLAEFRAARQLLQMYGRLSAALRFCARAQAAEGIDRDTFDKLVRKVCRGQRAVQRCCQDVCMSVWRRSV